MARSDNIYWRSVLTKTLRSLWVETSPEKAIARAQRYIEKGRHDAAAGVLRAALEAGGEDASVRMELSRILIAMNDSREAASGLKTFLKAQPGEAHQIQELLAWARANHHEAQVLNEVLAEHHVGRREFRRAFEALENLDKENLKTLLDARLANLKRFLEKKPDSVPRSALPLVYLTALIHEAQGEDPKAIEVYHRLISAHPGELSSIDERLRGITARHYRSASLRAALAGIYETADVPDRAVDEYVGMAENDPRLAPQAAESLKRLVEKVADPSGALMGLVNVLRMAGKPEDLFEAAGDLLQRDGPAQELLELLEGMVAAGKQDPRLHFLVGEAARRAGKLARAVAALGSAAGSDSPEIQERAREALEGILTEHPEETRAAEALADHAIRGGRPDDAVTYLSRLPVTPATAATVSARLQAVLLSHPGHDGAADLLEKIAPALDDPQLAALFLRRRLRENPQGARIVQEKLVGLLAQFPQDPGIRMAAVESKAACDEMEEAWQELQPLLDGTTGPDPALFHLMVHIGGSSKDLCREISERFSSMSPALAGTPEGQFCLGEMAARCGDTQAAVDSFRSAAAFSPAAAAAAVGAARELCGEGLTGQAAASLAELLVDTGDFGGASSLLSTLEGLGPYAGSVLAKIEKAHKKDPENSELRLALAGALAAAGRTGHARKLIDEGIQRGGASAPGALHLAAGDAWLRDGNLGEAVRSYTRAMAQDKTLAGEAVLRLDKVLNMDVGHAGAHLARGRGFLLDGNPREGVNALLTAWSIRPAVGGAIIKDLAFAARAFPLEPSVDLARAQLMMGQGDVEAATGALGAALKTSPVMAPEVLTRLQAVMRSHPSCAPAHLHAARAWRLRERYRESGEAYLAAFELDSALVDHVAAGLAELLECSPDDAGPYLARARFEEARGNPSMAADAYEAAAARGAEPDELCASLGRLASADGPHQGRTLLALARASRHLDRPSRAAEALQQAADRSPELLAPACEEADLLVEKFPHEPSIRLGRARILLRAMEPSRALPEAEKLLDLDPSLWKDAGALASEIADAGGDAGRCALLRSRALISGGRFDEAGTLLEQWARKAEGDLRAQMCVLRSRVDRRRGDAESASRWMEEAASLASDREAFLASLHDETRSAALAAVRQRSSTADRWRAMRALLDLGDVDEAASLAQTMKLSVDGGDDETGEEAVAAHELFARIACLRGRYGEAAALLESAPPSSLKGHVLRRAGRLVEAAACLEEAGNAAEEAAGLPARRIYRRLAAAEFLREPGCLEAETSLDFSLQRAERPDPGTPSRKETS
jgi:tetratricopeptide (TPR) repeat protein